MNNMHELERSVSSKHPGFSSYLECMSRAFVTGLASFGLSVSSTYFIQIAIRNKLPYEKKYFMPISFGFGTIIAWQVTAKRTKNCQSAWMASEDKHTYLSTN